MKNIRDKVELGVSAFTDDNLKVSHPDLTVAERVEVLDIRLMQLCDLVFEQYQADPDLKVAEFLSKLLTLAKRELTSGVLSDTSVEVSDGLSEFLSTSYMSQDTMEDGTSVLPLGT